MLFEGQGSEEMSRAMIIIGCDFHTRYQQIGRCQAFGHWADPSIVKSSGPFRQGRNLRSTSLPSKLGAAIQANGDPGKQGKRVTPEAEADPSRQEPGLAKCARHRRSRQRLRCLPRTSARKRRRDFSLRRPTTLQEQSGKKKRRPAAFEMTVGGWAEKRRPAPFEMTVGRVG